MNSIYKVIYSPALGCMIVVSEFAKGKGKKTNKGTPRGISASRVSMASVMLSGLLAFPLFAADLPTGANDLKPFYVKPFIPDELMNELCMTCKLTEQQSKDFTKVYKSKKQEHFKANYGAWKPSGEQKTDNSNKNKVSLTETMIVTAASEALKTFEIRTKVELDDDKSEMSRFSLLELLETKVTKAEAQNAIKFFMFQVVNKVNSKNKGLIKKGNQRSQNYTRRKGGGGRGGSRKNGGRG